MEGTWGAGQNEYGTAGEEIVVPVHALAEYPAGLSAVEAAAIWMQYLTAYGTVVELGHIKRGDIVYHYCSIK
jgi:NADPH:quinone reductase-like Zn-dependent oxidoreductase